jgi:hypothetical protein
MPTNQAAAGPLLIAPGKEWAMRRIANLGLIVWGPSDCSDDVFRSHLFAARDSKSDFPPIHAVLNVTHGFAPNARQRSIAKELSEAAGFDTLKATAVVSDSRLVVGALTALHWIMPKNRLALNGWRLADWAKAVDWVTGYCNVDSTLIQQLVVDMNARLSLQSLP